MVFTLRDLILLIYIPCNPRILFQFLIGDGLWYKICLLVKSEIVSSDVNFLSHC